jgi:type I restriction enzyme S subunit
VAVSDVELTINQDMKALIPRDDVDPDYLLFCLRAFGDDILQECSKEGTTVASIDSDKLYSYEIPLPPLEEQKEIAGKVSSIHGTIDELTQEIETVNDRIGILSDSVLSHVFKDEISQQAKDMVEADGGTEESSLDDFS